MAHRSLPASEVHPYPRAAKALFHHVQVLLSRLLHMVLDQVRTPAICSLHIPLSLEDEAPSRHAGAYTAGLQWFLPLIPMLVHKNPSAYSSFS